MLISSTRWMSPKTQGHKSTTRFIPHRQKVQMYLTKSGYYKFLKTRLPIRQHDIIFQMSHTPAFPLFFDTGLNKPCKCCVILWVTISIVCLSCLVRFMLDNTNSRKNAYLRPSFFFLSTIQDYRVLYKHLDINISTAKI